MIGKNTLKIYEIVLFAVALSFFLFEILSVRFEIFQLLNSIGFPILFALYIVWVVLLKINNRKNLTNFELLIFILLFGVTIKLIILVLAFLGFVGYTIFGLWLEEFLAVIAVVFLFFAIFLFFFYTAKDSNSKINFKLNNADIFMVFIGFIFLLLIFLYYFFCG